MPETERKDYPKARLLLDYLRTLSWPVVAIGILAIYGGDIRKMFTEREVEFPGGLRIGARIDDINNNLSDEVAEIRSLLGELQSSFDSAESEVAEEIEIKITSLEESVDRELNQIQQIVPGISAPATADVQVQTPLPLSREIGGQTAEDWEQRGFTALIERDIDAAISAFTNAYNLWPQYHNVSEIRKLLRRRRPELEDPANDAAWSLLYRSMLAQYSWGMPPEVRAAIRQAK